jgi:hypothetical protein
MVLDSGRRSEEVQWIVRPEGRQKLKKAGSTKIAGNASTDRVIGRQLAAAEEIMQHRSRLSWTRVGDGD